MAKVKNQNELEKADNSGIRIDQNIEDVPQKKRYKNLKILTFSVIMICFGAFYVGWVLGELSGVSQYCLNEVFGVLATSSPMYGILQGAISFGAIFGAITTPFLMRCFSQRNIILLVNLAILVVIGINQVPDVYVLLITRLFLGFFAGVLLSMVPIYINDICPKEILGNYAAFTGLFLILGLLLNFVLAEIFIQTNASCEITWRFMFGTIAIFIAFQTILILAKIIPQSPNCLIRADKKEEAKQIISIFIEEQFLEQVFKSKIDEIQFEAAHASNEDDSVKINPWMYFVAFSLFIWLQFVGINVVAIQIGVYIATHSNLGLIFAISVISSQFVGAILAIWLNSKVGRRPIILVSNGIFLGLNICLTVLFLKINDWPAAITLLLIVSSMYTFLFGLTISSVCWSYIAETMPAQIIPIIYMVTWIGSTILLAITPIVTAASNDNPYIMFILFSAVTLIAFIINYFLIVETKGVTKIQLMRKISIQKH